MNNKYKVERTISLTVIVDADTPQEALQKAEWQLQVIKERKVPG